MVDRDAGRLSKTGMLILHINREVMRHGGEIGLPRDLYRATGATTQHSRLLPDTSGLVNYCH